MIRGHKDTCLNENTMIVNPNNYCLHYIAIRGYCCNFKSSTHYILMLKRGKNYCKKPQFKNIFIFKQKQDLYRAGNDFYVCFWHSENLFQNLTLKKFWHLLMTQDWNWFDICFYYSNVWRINVSPQCVNLRWSQGMFSTFMIH